MERRLTAILAADVVGFSRLMERDEADTLVRLKALRRELVQPRITVHKGRIVKLMGDGLLADFPSAVEAVRCAAGIQEAMTEREAGQHDERRIQLRIGVNIGDIIVEGSDIYGDGVNVAARLEGLAEPGGICISGPAFDAIDGKLDLAFDDIGAQRVKNIAKPVRTYRLATTRRRAASAAPSQGPLPLPDKPSIAVLPFTNMSGDPKQEYFSDGITEDIITELSRFRTFFVIARNSSFAFKDHSVSASRIGTELGVQFIVEGSVRKSAKRVRVTAQLIEAESGNHLWAERYDRDLEDIFAVQDEVTQAIVSALPGRLDAAAVERGRKWPTESLTAYDCLLRGEWYLRRGDFDNVKARVLFEEAAEIDPNSARAQARIAAWHAYSIYSHEVSVETAFGKAHEHIARALELENHDATIHAIAAMVYLHRAEHALTETHIERAMALNPNDVEVLYRRAMTAVYHGDPQAGLAWLRKAMRLDPFYPDYWLEVLFDASYLSGNDAAAAEAFKRWRNPPIHMYAQCAAALAQMGDMTAAAKAVETYERKRPEEHDITEFVKRHTRICKHQADRDRWLEGYRRAGFPV